MKFTEIREKLANLIVFSLKDVEFYAPNFRQQTFSEWEKRGWINKLRNNKYVLGDFKANDKDYYILANRLYEPSYVSLEMALNHYGVIPEAVQVITSVTTLKTNIVDTEFAQFIYKTVKPKLFWGYTIIEHKNHGIKVAELEKAILDYLYLNPSIVTVEDFEGLRWNKEEIRRIDWEKLEKYQKIFTSKSIDSKIKNLKQYLKHD